MILDTGYSYGFNLIPYTFFTYLFPCITTRFILFKTLLNNIIEGKNLIKLRPPKNKPKKEAQCSETHLQKYFTRLGLLTYAI